MPKRFWLPKDGERLVIRFLDDPYPVKHYRVVPADSPEWKALEEYWRRWKREIDARKEKLDSEPGPL